jgi:hypothetical protein
MSIVRVPVLRPFDHEGRTVTAGESVSVRAVEALALARKGLVSLSRSYSTTQLKTEPAPEPEQPRRRRGRPRKEASDDAEAPRRTYRRRDLTSEP